MQKKVLIIMILLNCILFSFGQNSAGVSQVIPPSPTAVQFQRYGEYPITHYTGLPSISIPIYTIEEGDIKVPITLDYHASGTRPDDVSGVAGLGWTLNTGGSISRTINGLPDGDVQFWIPPQKAINIQYWDYDRARELQNLERGWFDHEYDVYSYSFLGQSGKYIIEEGRTRPFFFKENSLIWNDVGLGFSDENGIKYDFGETYEYQTYKDRNDVERSAISTWYLSTITSGKNPAHRIGYSYQQGPSYIFDKNIYQYILDDFYDNPIYNCHFFPYTPCNAGGLSQPGNLIRYYTYLPSQIGFSLGKILFNLNASTKMLNSIEVFDKNNNLLKKVEFNIIPFPSNYAVNHFSNYKLESIVFKDAGNAEVQKYSFNYYKENQVDAKPEAFNPTAGKDHWGFYNGTTHTVGIPPFSTFLTKEGGFPYAKTIGGNAIKTPSEEFTKTYMLNKITYPTGGYTEFEFEGNVAHGNVPVGGLRIKTISNYSGTNQLAYQKKYTYTQPFVEVSPSIEYYINGMAGYAPFAEGTSIFRRIYMSEQPSIDFSPQGSSVVYPFITETDGNSEIHYTYDVGNAYTYGQLNFPAAQISFSTPNDYYFKKFTNYYKPWNYGNLLSKWANVGEMNEEYEYEEFITDTAHDFLMTRWVVPHLTGTPEPNFDATFPQQSSVNVFNYADHYYLSGGKRIKKAISHYSKDGLLLTNVKEYFYDNPNRPTIATRFSTNNSKGETITTYLKYPFDLATSSPYNDMTEKNIISPVIEQTQVNTTLNIELSKSKTNYSSWQNNTIIQPASIENSVLGNPYQTEATIDNYDAKGNILQVTAKDGIVTSYIWGYNQQYPVAKIIGRSYNDAITQSGISLSVVSAPANDNALRTELNKLRVISGALVYTYTYKQLIGITSETDPTGNTQYYEYDAFGRLSLIRDKDQNILKRFCYNYQGQATTCSADPAGAPNWQPTGETRCQTCKTNSNFFTDAIERKEIDNNPNSPTYTNIRWVVSGHGGACSYNGWQNTSTPVQCQIVDGVNNGKIIQEQKNIDPCSDDYGHTRWMVVGTNTNACPIPSIFYSGDHSGYYNPSCLWPYVAEGQVYVSVPDAMFSSTVSPSDANDKAMAYAFHVADSLGTCVLAPITLNFTNGIYDNKFYVEINDTNDQLLYSFQVTGPGFYNLGSIPVGTYNVHIYPWYGEDNYTYDVGCGFSIYGNDVMLYNVTLDHSCNNIYVN